MYHNNKTNKTSKTTAGSSSKFAQLLQQSPSERDSKDREYRVREAELQLDADILATERSIATAEKKYEEVVMATPFNSQNIINAKNQIEAAKAGLEALQELKAELF